VILLFHIPKNNYIKETARFEVFTVLTIQIEVFWVVTPASIAVGPT